MPLSADRCQVTWGPNPLKKAEVSRGGSCVDVGAFSEPPQSVHVCPGGGVCVCV